MDTKNRLDALTGLRFLAALAVLVFHLFALHPEAAVSAEFRRVTYEGFAGVSFFFVLSGFVLAYTYHDRLARPGRRGLAAYYRSRVARVWPLHLATLALVVAFPMAPYCVHCGRETGPLALATNALLVHAWLPLEFRTFTSYNSVSWSLSVEAFFYLILPLVLWRAGRRAAGPGRTALAAVAVWAVAAAVVFAFRRDPGMRTAYLLGVGPIGRSAEFLVGVLCGLAFVRAGAVAGSRAVWTAVELGLLAVVAGLVWWSDGVAMLLRQNGYYTAAFAAVVTAFAVGRGAVSGLLAGRVTRYLGEISFALFLVHMLVFVHLGRVVPAGPVGMAVVVAASLLAAAVLHHVVELPARALILGRGRPADPVAGRIELAARRAA